MFVELCKLLENSTFSHIIFIILTDLDSTIDDPHYKFRVVLIFSGVPFVVKVIAYFDSASEDKIVLLIINSINLGDDLFHAWSAS